MIDLSQLNPMQRKAVEHGDGPLLVLAGAGSGKTRVLTYRIAKLIEEGTPARSILAITFTNKAAREMKERVLSLCGAYGEEAWISTFHSSCARILRQDIEKIGYKRSFSIYDDDDSMTVVKRLLKNHNVSEKELAPRSVKSMISDCKNKMLSPDDWFSQSRRDKTSQLVCAIMKEYESELRENNALDFDDLLIKTLELLVQNPPVLEAYKRRFTNILVDEYQDTNIAQYEFVRLLVGDKKNICVVGDDDQSIYGWRGADIRNILNFERDFAPCTVVKLEQNYRSVGNILEAANGIISNNDGRKSKKLWTESQAGEKIHVYTALDERDEAYWICQQISSQVRQGFKYSDMAVLYRTNAQSRIIEESLVRAGVPYSVYGGLRFYDRKEIRDLIAYLRVLNNPDDDVSALRILNEPKRGIGDSTQQAIAQYAKDEGISFFAAVLDCENIPLAKRTKFLVSEFSEQMMELLNLRYELPADQLLQKILEITQYEEQYKKVKNDENDARMENIKELQGAVLQYAESNPNSDLSDFLENIALVTDLDGMNGARNALTLMTLHSAKGLEFPIVFIPGMEEGIFPTSRASFEESRMEEERRLCYVGVTRAMQKIFLLNARTRMLYGNRSANMLSRFVSEIPQELIDDGRRKNTAPAPSGRYETLPKPAGALNIPGVRKGFYGGIPDYMGQRVVRSAAGDIRQVNLFNVGDKVWHKTYHDGVVTEIREVKGSKRIVVRFGDETEKIFPADTAPIIKKG